MNRRRFLSYSVCAGIGSISGCLSSDDEVAYATMQRLTVMNRDGNDPVIVELKIEQDDTDEVVHEDSYELGAGFDDQPIDCVWPDEPLQVMARSVDEDDWATFTTADKEGCLLVFSETDSNGTSFVSANEECPARSPTCHTDVEE